MFDLTTEQLCQRALECRLADARELDLALAEAGGTNVSLEELIMVLMEKEICTNWQLSRLVEGENRGYFYGDWKVWYMVGCGTFARVYRGCHTRTAEIRAIRVLRNRYAKDLEAQEKFLRMGNKGQGETIYEVGKASGRIYMVVDFIETSASR